MWDKKLIRDKKIKIAFISDKYHWSSYSVVRSLYEELGRHPEIESVTPYEFENADLMICAGVNARVMERKVPIVRIGLSDPNLFFKELSDNCDLYITNDYKTSTNLDCYYMPCFADKNYFKKLDIKKEIDILFVGNKHHPFVKDRAGTISKLRKEGFNIKCFGHGWANGFIEGDRLVQEYNKAHLCLDLTDDTTSLGSRIFQSSMCGTPVITKGREDLKELLKDSSEEVLLYGSYPDLVNTLRIVFSESAKEEKFLEEIGLKARERCLKDHDVFIRVNGLLEHLNDKGLL
jgi:hypothetical protein